MNYTCRTCGRSLDESQFYKGEQKQKHPRCIECSRAYAKWFRQTYPERAKEISAKTRAKNRDKINQRNREYYAKTKNDPAHIAARKASVEKGSEKWKANDRKRRHEFNAKWKTPCAKCGESRLYLVQFHHIDPSTKAFCIGANATDRKEEDLITEIKKCVCLCSNCHDEFHYFYGGKPSNPVEALHEYLKGESNYEKHHNDP